MEVQFRQITFFETHLISHIFAFAFMFGTVFPASPTTSLWSPIAGSRGLGAAWTAQVQLDQMALTPLLAAHPWRKGLSLAQARAQVGTHTWNDGGLQLDSVCGTAA